MRAFVDLHCHTAASFDSLSPPERVARVAAERGLTHLSITDHGVIDGALRARDAAPAGLTVIVGEEIRTLDGDLTAAFIERPIAGGRPAAETIAEVHDQGGLAGIPHPFDRYRGSMLREARLSAIGAQVDWVEAWNARAFGGANDKAAAFAREHQRPGVAVSDAHSLIEVGIAYVVVDGDPSTPVGLLAALDRVELVTGRASYTARLATPIAKLVNRARRGRGVTPRIPNAR